MGGLMSSRALDRILGKGYDTLRALEALVPQNIDAVTTDAFDRRMYGELLEEAPALAEMVGSMNETYDYTHDLVRDSLMEFWQGEPTVRDPQEMDPTRLVNRAVAEQALTLPEMRDARPFTRYDRYGAAMATIAFTDELKKMLDDLKSAESEQEAAQQAQQALKEALERLASTLEGMGGDPGEQEEQPGGAPAAGGDGESDELGEGEQGAADAVAQAVADAENAAQDAAQAQEQASQRADQVGRAAKGGLQRGVQTAARNLADEHTAMTSWGISPGYLERLSFQERKDLAQRLFRSRLRQAAPIFGRFRMRAAAERMRRVEHGREEIFSVEMSNRIEDALASEFGWLALPEPLRGFAEMEFLSRVEEHQLLSKAYMGLEPIGDGAIVNCIDTSYSMRDRDKNGVTKEAYAKGFALGLLDTCMARKRPFIAVLFASAEEIKVFKFLPGKVDPNDVIDMAEYSFGGGTNFESPLGVAANLIETEFNTAGTARADIVFTTDDEAGLSPVWTQKFLEQKERLNFRVWGVMLGRGVGNVLGAVANDVRSIHDYSDPEGVADILRAVA